MSVFQCCLFWNYNFVLSPFFHSYLISCNFLFPLHCSGIWQPASCCRAHVTLKDVCVELTLLCVYQFFMPIWISYYVPNLYHLVCLGYTFSEWMTGSVVADSHSIVDMWRNYFSQLFNVHGVKDVGQTEIHTAEPLAPEPSAFQFGLAMGKLKVAVHLLLLKSQQKWLRQGVRNYFYLE